MGSSPLAALLDLAKPGTEISREAQALICQLVQENPRWGAPRLVGELQALGHDVSIRSVRRYRHAVRRRPPSQRWRTFLRYHSPHIWATDLFTVQTVTFRTPWGCKTPSGSATK